MIAFLKICLFSSFLVAAISCKKENSAETIPVKITAPKTNEQIFEVKGIIRELKADGKTVKIKHEAVTNYMPAMTMDFEVKDSKELRGLKVGDAIIFKMVVQEDNFWIERLKKLNSSPEELPSRETFRRVLDVELLKVGEALPEYHFTNELGQSVSTTNWRGNGVVFTFIFTACPIPTFCPRMSQNFSEVQKKLKTTPNAPTNWKLFSISFDPEKDSPAVLKNYAKRYESDSAHWNFLTGDLLQITAIAQQVGQLFWSENGSINHNLRTVVVDANGKIQKIIPENKWTPDELVEEILKAAKVSSLASESK